MNLEGKNITANQSTEQNLKKKKTNCCQSQVDKMSCYHFAAKGAIKSNFGTE